MNNDEQNPLAEFLNALIQTLAETRKNNDSEGSKQIYFDLVSEAVADLIKQPDDEIAAMLSSLNSTQIAYLRGIAEGGAAEAVRNHSREWLVLGLRGLFLAYRLHDYGETYEILKSLTRSARKIGVNITAIGNEAFGNGEVNLPEEIANYLANPIRTPY